MRFVWEVDGRQIGAWRAMHHFPNLTTVDMVGCTDFTIGPSLPYVIDTLNFAECWNFRMTWLYDVRSVRCLRMEQSFDPCEYWFNEYQDKLAGLEELSIRHCFSLDFYLGFVRWTPKIRKLWLSVFPRPSVDWLEPLAALENLVYLSLNSCIRLTDEALLLVSDIRSLKTLDISNCPELTESGIAEVKARMPGLEIIR